MGLTLCKNVEFGSDYAGLTGVGGVSYTVLDATGSIVSGPTTTGVAEVVTGSGIYSAKITFPDSFLGQLLWSAPATGSLSVSYAVEQQNYLEANPKVDDTWSMVNSLTGTITGLSGTIQGLWDVAFGRWKIDSTANTMTFYDSTGTKTVAVFNLYDNTGTPAFDSVFERRLTGAITP